MTSKVTVECHNYPVLVEQLSVQSNNPQGSWNELTRVAPSEKRDFTLHSGVQLRITELPQEVENSS